MNITLLGTGTSSGVPVIGCTCATCLSSDPHDKRLRSSVMIEEGDTRLLIDCGPDFRQQMLRVPFRRIDAVLVTHEHYDHVGGLDDLRMFCMFGPINIYGEHPCIDHIAERMPYCFGTQKYPSAPTLHLHAVGPYEPFHVGSMAVMPLRVMHGELPILGYRLGRFAYITDMATTTDATLEQLRGVDCLVVNALRKKPHPTHQSIEQAVAFAAKVGAAKTYFTHLAHSAGLHSDSIKLLPPTVAFAYDGLKIVL